MTSPRIDLSLAAWHKSSRSSSQGQNCVEIATNLSDVVAIRDSKNSEGPTLTFSSSEWDAFLAGVKAGEFD